MAELITETGRKSIKKMAEISHLAKSVSLMPTPEDFALRFIGDMRSIARMVNSISKRIDEILDRYSSIPGEFLLKGFDEVLDKLNDVNDYAKFAIAETTSVVTSSLESVQSLTEAVSSATSALTSATLQIGGGLSYGAVGMAANIKLAMTGNGRRRITEEVVQDVAAGKVPVQEMEAEIDRRIAAKVGNIDNAANSIRDWTTDTIENSTESIDGFFDKASNGLEDAIDWVDGVKEDAEKPVDDLIKKVENAKKEVEEKIKRVKKIFDNLTKNFDECFGFLNGKNFAEDTFRNISNTAAEIDSPVFDALGDLSGEVADFIKNFNIGKVITAVGGLVVGAGAATVAMDLLPSIDVDRMLREIIGGVDVYTEDRLRELYYNKNSKSFPDLLEVPDSPWVLNKDDLIKYNADGYKKYLEQFSEANNNSRNEIYQRMLNAKNWSEISAITKENKEKMKENESALKAMRKVRRDAIKAKQIEKYKEFLNTELEYLREECSDIEYKIKKEWDTMMNQYTTSVKEIKNFFSEEGYGGNEKIDRCCDRINDDAEQIVELCGSISVELINTVSMVPTPYAVGACVDMPVHKILAFFKDIKIIITFLKNLLRLGIDIMSQLTILAKIVSDGMKSLAEIINTLRQLLGVDLILNLIDFLLGLFRPKLIDAKILLENSLSPIYYNETEDYEARHEALEALLNDRKDGGVVDIFRYTDDRYNDELFKTTFGGVLVNDNKVEEALKALEEKGEREIVAYRSPILNETCDDFAGWIFYHADAYDYMDKTWKSSKKRYRNRLIKNASKKNKIISGKLRGGVAQLKKDMSFGYYENDEYIAYSVTGYDAYFWYIKWTNDPTDCNPDFDNEEYVYDEEGDIVGKNDKFKKDVVSPIQTTSNGSLVELNDGRRVFVEGKNVKSGDFVNVDGVKYRVK
jgi:hypothetical protein